MNKAYLDSLLKNVVANYHYVLQIGEETHCDKIIGFSTTTADNKAAVIYNGFPEGHIQDVCNVRHSATQNMVYIEYDNTKINPDDYII